MHIANDRDDAIGTSTSLLFYVSVSCVCATIIVVALSVFCYYIHSRRLTTTVPLASSHSLHRFDSTTSVVSSFGSWTANFIINCVNLAVKYVTFCGIFQPDFHVNYSDSSSIVRQQQLAGTCMYGRDQNCTQFKYFSFAFNTYINCF